MIIQAIKDELPATAQITDVSFEGSEVILYTENRQFFTQSGDLIRRIVGKVKKRIEVRADPSVLRDEETTKEAIYEIVPKEAGIRDIYFEPEFAKVVIHAEKPGMVIGKAGETLAAIKEKTFWTPDIKRAPMIDSELIKSIRKMLHREAAYRKKFLNALGEKIYAEGGKEPDWVRLTTLGGFREVGRSCLFLQTPQTKLLLDCGMSVKKESNPFPHLEAPEFRIQDLDAIIVTHAHTDHAGMVPYLYEYGFRGPVYCTRPTRDTMTLMQLDYLKICQRENSKPAYSSKGIEEELKHCITLEYGEVSDIAPDMRITLQNAGHILGSAAVHIHVGNGLHNVLYSLDWTAPVVMINPEGQLITEPIGKIVDESFENTNVVSDGFVEQTDNEKGWKTVAFNPKTLKAEIVPVTSFIRHPITEKLYRIRASGGKETIVTASHNVFQVIDGEVKSVKTKNLRPGQFILAANNLPVEVQEPIIDLQPYTHELRLKYSDAEIQAKLWELCDRARALNPENYEDVLAYVSDHYAGHFLREIAIKHTKRIATIRTHLAELGIKGHPRRGHTLPSKLRITPPLARFIGYYVAEGSSRANSVRIANYDRTILEDCLAICKTELDIDGVIHKNNAIFDSRQFEFLLKRILCCGESAYSKRVPKIILQAPSDVVWEFLRGYYRGDGNLRVRPSGCCISANSKNPELIRDISLLLARFGIVPALEFNQTSGMYMAHVNAVDDIEKMLAFLGIEKWATAFAAKIQQKKRSGANQRIPLDALTPTVQKTMHKTSYHTATSAGLHMLQKLADLDETDQRLISSCFSFAKILSIEEVEPTSRYVYDLSVEGYENFLTGQGFLFVHNTGDMRFARTALFDPAWTNYSRIETVIIESTYGLAERSPYENAKKSLETQIRKVLDRGGKVLIPAFATGRGQEVIAILSETNLDTTMYLDGMLWDATAIHTAYPEFMARHIQNAILHKGKNPFLDPRLKGIGSGQERRAVLDSASPCVVVSTSGMLVGGPALDYLQRFAESEKNMLLFAGYQGEGTLGRRIQGGWKNIQIDDANVELKLEISTVEGLGGHSSGAELLAFIRHLKTKPKKILTNHGEVTRCIELARQIHQMYRIETEAPKNLETIRLR